MRAERRQDMGRAIEQGIGGRENPDGVRKGMPVKCKKPLKKRLRSFRKGRRIIKKRPADLSIFTVVQQLVSRGLAGSVGAKITKIS